MVCDQRDNNENKQGLRVKKPSPMWNQMLVKNPSKLLRAVSQRVSDLDWTSAMTGT